MLFGANGMGLSSFSSTQPALGKAIQGHSRLSTLIPIESLYAISY